MRLIYSQCGCDFRRQNDDVDDDKVDDVDDAWINPSPQPKSFLRARHYVYDHKLCIQIGTNAV